MDKKSTYVTVRIDEQMEKAIEDRMEYLKRLWGVPHVTKSDAIRHAIMKTNYTRKKSNRKICETDPTPDD